MNRFVLSLGTACAVLAGCGGGGTEPAGTAIAPDQAAADTDSSRAPFPRTVNDKAFFTAYRRAYGPMNQGQVDGLNQLLARMKTDREPAINSRSTWQRQIAYTFATVKHEVADTYKPITEYGNANCPRYDGGCTYKGRGYVQLTHRYNYRKMSPVVGVDLVAYPGRALEPAIAYRVMSYGMHHGSFTGRRLGDYITSTQTDYLNARRVINGTDRANLIKGYAQKFQSIMEASSS
jgi:predicted chitinase